MIICAIQIGSSSILAVAADKDVRNGSLSNIQIESEPARDCISHGCVVNVEKTAMHLRSLIQKLGNRMRATLSRAYVGIGGMSMQSLVQLPSVQLPDYDILASEAISGNRYQLTIAQKFVRQGVLAAMERAGIGVAEIIALPQATATILTEGERQRGCVLVDIGAGTTTVSIYKDNDLRHLAVIPLGGESVTLDIQSAGCSRDDAERIKLEWSNVGHQGTADSASAAHATALFADKALPFPQSKLNQIALCRYEEIAANVQHQIELSGLKDQLEAGCVLTGGASMQSGLSSLLQRCLSVGRVETRAYSERAFLGSDRKPHLTNAFGLLSFASIDCQATAPEPAATTTSVRPAASTATRPAVMPDGQTTLDLTDPDPDPDPTNEPIADTNNFRKTFGRFFSDLFTGQ